MPELRIDRITGREVLISSKRELRPHDYRDGKADPADSSQRQSCPFCSGHEGDTPPAAAETLDAAGHWQVRVVPNKYPAVAGDTGSHEVVIESPRHVVEATDLSGEQLARVLRMHRDRLAHWLADGRFEYVAVFKNSGPAAGASLAHVHSQILALPMVPSAAVHELSGAEEYLARSGCCFYCELVENAWQEARVVSESQQFLAVCPHAPRLPYETWILPRAHQPRFESLGDEAAEELASVVHDLLVRLQRLVPQAAYNLLLRTSPRGSAHEAAYHWHWQLIPRTSNLAGLELGSGVFINSLAPELAAERLRNATRQSSGTE